MSVEKTTLINLAISCSILMLVFLSFNLNLKKGMTRLIPLFIFGFVCVYFAYCVAPNNVLKQYKLEHSQSIDQAIFSQTLPSQHDVTFCNALLLGSARSHRLSAQCYENYHKTNVSQYILQEAFDTWPNDTHILYAKTKYSLEHYGIDSIEFVENLDKLRKQAPNHIDGLWLGAAQAFYQGRYQKALDYLEIIEKQASQTFDANKQAKLMQFKQTIKEALKNAP